MSSNQRQHFRIEYPIPDRPKVEIDGKLYPVLDLSEKGLKLLGGPRFKPKTTTKIHGKVYFHDKTMCHVIGVVLRVNDDESVVLKLSDGVPLPKIMDEQRQLIRKYKPNE